MSSEIQGDQHPASADPAIVSVIEELSGTLRHSGIMEPRRVATDIVAALLEVPRSWPALNRGASIDTSTVEAARRAAHLIGRGAPFGYAVGSVQFRYLDLKVDERVLIPRPETEVLVGEVLQRMESTHAEGRSWGTAVDIGTGSGAIALSLASEGRFDRVIGTDASADALDVARANRDRSAASLVAEVELRHGSLMAPVRGVTATVLVSNPPYVAFSEVESLPASVREWEPAIALMTGDGGLSATAAIVREGAGVLASGGLLALEVDERRASLVADMIMQERCYAEVSVRLDLTGRERFVFASRI